MEKSLVTLVIRYLSVVVGRKKLAVAVVSGQEAGGKTPEVCTGIKLALTSGVEKVNSVLLRGSRQRRGTKQSMKMVTAAIFTILFIALVLPSASFGIGLEVDPGEINIQNVALGQKAAVSVLGGERMKLRVKNKGASACIYTINILPTAQTTAVLNPGYKDIPDTSWIFPESKEVEVPGNSAKEVELYLKIPKKKEYYNKKYQAIIEVKSKKNSPEELFVLACQLKMLFSTSAKRNR